LHKGQLEQAALESVTRTTAPMKIKKKSQAEVIVDSCLKLLLVIEIVV